MKPGSGEGLALARADFPGGHAGASLKRVRLAGDRLAVRHISPADTPGPH